MQHKRFKNCVQMAAILDSGTEIELTTCRDVFGLQNTTIVNILNIYQKKETCK